ncbi:MAG TPA: hypothetical protein EYP35_00195 [Desulfobacterales bacterium]|nr:hypothetical protein [Desulfobacterales bacterium]
MNTREKIDRAADTSQLCLHKEGIFYKLYNQHAMLFTANIKELKINGKFIKAVNQQVYSCGFPSSIIEDIKKRLTAHGGVINESEKLLTAANIHWEKENDYSRWCEQQKQAAVTAGTECDQGRTSIEKRISAFQVMRKTPMEAMNFIIGLQEELHNTNE